MGFCISTLEHRYNNDRCFEEAVNALISLREERGIESDQQSGYNYLCRAAYLAEYMYQKLYRNRKAVE